MQFIGIMNLSGIPPFKLKFYHFLWLFLISYQSIFKLLKNNFEVKAGLKANLNFFGLVVIEGGKEWVPCPVDTRRWCP